MNLFVNAWQAMPNGGKIMIRSENAVVEDSKVDEMGLESPGTYVKVTVADTGIGMDEDIMSRIFDPFFTTKERGHGTGIGLATTYGIIKSHKGMVKVESKPGKGSAFMFFLLAKKNRVEIPREPEEKHAIINGKGSILLVDDEKGVIEVCSEMLETLGYQVTAVSSGKEALEAIASGKDRMDLVILDLVMPRMSGQQVFEKIRALDPDIKVLVSSGYSREEEISKMMQKGCDVYILKPFDMSTLSKKLDAVLKTREKVYANRITDPCVWNKYRVREKFPDPVFILAFIGFYAKAFSSGGMISFFRLMTPFNHAFPFEGATPKAF